MKFTRFTFGVLSAAFILVVGCVPVMRLHYSHPVAGWTYRPFPAESPYRSFTNTLNKAIVDDYQAYITTNKLQPLESMPLGAIMGYYEDGQGQHAIQFVVESSSWWLGASPIWNTLWSYTLIYDKENKRMKTVRRYEGKMGNAWP